MMCSTAQPSVTQGFPGIEHFKVSRPTVLYYTANLCNYLTHEGQLNTLPL